MEWSAIRSALYFENKSDEYLMIFRFDDTPIQGLLKSTGHIDIKNRSPKDVAHLILERLQRREIIKKPEEKGEIHTARIPHNLPFGSIGNLLCGREDEFRELMETKVASAITQAIQGLGGIGKTRLAIEIAWRALKEGNIISAFFIDSDSPESLQKNIAKLPEMLDLPEHNEKEEAIQFKAALRWLESHSGWLLIFDNVDTEKAASKVRELLPTLSKGRVIITSRRHGWGANVKDIDLKVLKDDVAKKFLLDRTQNRLKTPDDESFALKLAQLLGGLPLALEQAGAFIAFTRCSLADYLEEWENDCRKAIEWIDPSDKNFIPVAVTWKRTYDILSGFAKVVLSLSSFFSPEPIPLWLFENGKQKIKEDKVFLKEDREKGGKIPRIREIVDELSHVSLVEWGENSFTVHKLVQEAVLLWIPEDKKCLLLKIILRMMNEYAPAKPYDIRNWKVWDSLRIHVEIILKRAEKLGFQNQITGLMNSLGTFLYSKALYSQSESLYRRALGIDERSYGKDHPKVAILLNNLALLLKDTNRLKEAEPLMIRALEIDEKFYGKDHAKVADRINNLAVLFHDTNRLKEAEPLMRRALEIDEKSLGKNHPNVSRDLNNLSLLLRDTNRLNEAESLMRRALEINERSLGNYHPNVATSLSNLAALLKDTNRIEEAEPLMKRALEIDEKFLGKDHPNVAIRLNNLAQLLQATNRLEEAEQLMRRSLEIHEKILGKNHSNVARVLNNLAQLLRSKKRLNEAEPFMRRALEILGEFKKQTGYEHPDFKMISQNYDIIIKQMESKN